MMNGEGVYDEKLKQFRDQRKNVNRTTNKNIPIIKCSKNKNYSMYIKISRKIVE
jgi:hypothetical protein